MKFPLNSWEWIARELLGRWLRTLATKQAALGQGISLPVGLPLEDEFSSMELETMTR
jgi:hypothetical protein